jgi:hypothetical protein
MGALSKKFDKTKTYALRNIPYEKDQMRIMLSVKTQ